MNFLRIGRISLKSGFLELKLLLFVHRELKQLRRQKKKKKKKKKKKEKKNKKKKFAVITGPINVL